MNAQQRRESVLKSIESTRTPLSASSLAAQLGVSRQVIVGDVAILRAGGHDIMATARGYVMPELRDANQFLGKLACCHEPLKTRDELYAIVDAGAYVVDAIVEHELYGEITGQLNLKNRGDVDHFIKKFENSEVKLLSELTNGIHLHTIACRDKAHFEDVYKILLAMGYLLPTWR